jgi:COMPASS component SWD3
MAENPQQPREFDAVLGGEVPPPLDGVVLGGLEGVKRRLASRDIQQQIISLKDALNYGEKGLDVVINALQSESSHIQSTAYTLLKKRPEVAVQNVLKKYTSWQNMRCLQTLEGHLAPVKCILITPDGQTIISGSQDKTIRVWDLHTGELRRIIEDTDTVFELSISPNGKTIISGGGSYCSPKSPNNTIKLWDMQTGKLQKEIGKFSVPIFSIAVIPDVYCIDSGYIINGDNISGINVWDLKTMLLQKTLTKSSLQWVTSVAVHYEGKSIISASRDQTIKIWDLNTGELKYSLPDNSTGTISLAISPDGKRVIAGCDDRTVKVWNLKRKKLEHLLEGHSQFVTSVVVTPYGQSIISASSDKTIRIWDLETGELQNILEGHLKDIFSIAISPNGQTIVSGSLDKTIKIWGVNL